jgi:hypothetical protein
MKRLLLVLLFFGFTTAGAVDVLLLDDNSQDISEDPFRNFPNLDMVEGKLDELGITYAHEHDNSYRYPNITENPDFLADYRIIVWYNDQRVITQDEYNTVLDWVEAGNYLVVTGYDSLGNPNDTLMAQLVGSTSCGDYPFCDHFVVSDDDNFIMNGDWETFSVGDSIDILPDATDHDWAQAAPGTRKIATAYTEHLQGPSKILLTEDVGDGGMIVYWNGNWDSIEWWRFTQTPETVNMFRNMIGHLVDLVHEAVVETSWGGIKGIFTP